jgi:hypothetical protein
MQRNQYLCLHHVFQKKKLSTHQGGGRIFFGKDFVLGVHVCVLYISCLSIFAIHGFDVALEKPWMPLALRLMSKKTTPRTRQMLVFPSMAKR